MNTWAIIVALLPTLMIVGTILAPALSNRHSRPARDWPSPESNGPELSNAGHQRLPTAAREAGLEGERSGDPSTEPDGDDQYFEDWMALQERFVN